MSNGAEKTFVVSEELATNIYRGLQTGSGFGTSRELHFRESLKDHLGLGSKEKSPPIDAITGNILIAYVITSTRLIGILEEQDPNSTEKQIVENIQIKRDETPQQTFERLLNIAIENSQRINLPLS